MKFWIKFFLIGILVHFFFFNIVNFSIGFENKIIWFWKEVLILAFFVFWIFMVFKNNKWKELQRNKGVFYLEVLFLLLVVATFLVTFLFKDIGAYRYLMAFKYDFFGFVIFFLFYNIFSNLDIFNKKTVEKLLYFYGKVIKVALVAALFWHVIIAVKPGVIDIFGYAPDIHEGQVGEKPPAVYLTKKNHGLARNQFLFERPINYGFRLIAFWPLFYVLFLRRRSLKKTYFRWLVYFLNVVSTFSRAAWGAWVFEILFLGVLDYRKNIKNFLKKIVLPLFIILGLVSAVGYRHIVLRYFSNTGHLELFQKGLSMFAENPIIGKGAGYVGPASHWAGGLAFNPENQFLQILIEFGIIFFILWMIIYLFMSFFGIYVFRKSDKKQKNNFRLWVMVAFSVGMLGLSIEGMVLHSFVDRMIVYPMMLLYGLSLGAFLRKEKNNK